MTRPVPAGFAAAGSANNGQVRPAVDNDMVTMTRRMSARDIDPDLQVDVGFG
ncbi:hypothetical protein [Dactylosporangium sp. CA-233914]|uniref:hypothetical protein n=1 Tax=Dactylosporangium sp. CA-233914 TaxID=3239934 RepID=UPI003D929CB9